MKTLMEADVRAAIPLPIHRLKDRIKRARESKWAQYPGKGSTSFKHQVFQHLGIPESKRDPLAYFCNGRPSIGLSTLGHLEEV